MEDFNESSSVGGKSEEIISMQTILNYTLALQREVEEFKKKESERRSILESKLDNMRQERNWVEDENKKLSEQNALLRNQLHEVTQKLLNVSSNFKFSGVQYTNSPKQRKTEPVFSFVREPDSFEKYKNFQRTYDLRKSMLKQRRSSPKTFKRATSRRSRSAPRTREDELSRSMNGRHSSIYEKLYDRESYTGVYAQRFKSNPKINHAANSHNVHDLSQILRTYLN